MQSIILNMLSWAREAGAIQMLYFRGDNLGITNKLGESDILTNADKASERFLIDKIASTYPDHAILSEEAGDDGKKQAEYRWVIDPLDGTTNFGNGLPIFCVSIGLQRNGITVAGVVFAPYLDEMFHAVKGQGAFLNGKPIAVSKKTSIPASVLCTGFPVDKDVNPDNNLDNFAKIFPQVRAVRRLGSAAVDLCYVAAGYLDGFWEIALHEWDVCAGMLIVEEAGGVCTRFRHDRGVSIVAAPPIIHDFLMANVSATPAL